MRDFQVKKKLIIAGLTLLVLADVALIFLNSRMSTPPQDRQLSLAADKRHLALVKEDVERATGIRDKRQEVLKKFDDFEDTLLPASKGYSVITQEMDEYARDTHLLVNGVKYREKDVEGRNLQELLLDSSVTGDYNGIVRFLNHLQRSKNVYIVDSLDVDSENPSQGGPVGSLRVTLHLRTFFRKA